MQLQTPLLLVQNFNTGVNELASKAITVQAAGGGSKVTVTDVIYDELQNAGICCRRKSLSKCHVL